MASTLIAHSPKFESKLTTLEGLRQLPEPMALGLRHKPVPHHVLVEGLLHEIEQREMVPVRQEYALGHKGEALFGVIDLEHKGRSEEGEERGISFGFRSSTDSSLAIKAVAGTRVFVCDNLALSGNMIAFNRKSTTGLDLGQVIAGGFDKFIEHEHQLEINIARLELTSLSDGKAKQIIFDVFNAKVVPVRLFDDVSRFYFTPKDDQPDVQPRTMWGLHNAFTRAMKDLTPQRLFGATVALGKAFELTVEPTEDPEGAVQGEVEPELGEF